MGIYDRQYYRDEEERGGFQLSGPQFLVTKLVIVTVAVWVLDLLVPPLKLNHLLALKPDVLTEPWNWWQLLSYGFAHAALGDQAGMFHIGLNMFVLWMFGREVEMKYGAREFLWFYLVAIVVAGLVWLLLQRAVPTASLLVGASGAVTATVLLFALNFPHRTVLLFFVIPAPAWLLAVLYVVFDLLGAIERTGNVAYEAHLAGAAFAFAYYRLGWKFNSLLPGRRWSFRWPKRKPKLKVHDPETYYRELDREADRVLDKMHRQGESSLTNHERQVLEDYSRRMRQKHR